MSSTRVKADITKPGNLAAPMSGKVDIRVRLNEHVNKGDSVGVLNSLKTEMPITAPISGRITNILVNGDDSLDAGDLILEISE